MCALKRNEHGRVICQHAGCENEATHAIAADLRAYADAQPERTPPFVYTCEQHVPAKLEDVLFGPLWDMVAAMFEHTGYPPPSPRYSTLYAAPLEKRFEPEQGGS